MERTLDPAVLASALGDYRPGGVLPSAQDLLATMTEMEVAAFRDERDITDEVLGTAWYLHGLAALDPEVPGFDAGRIRQAFAVSAHLLDLALGDDRRSPADRLQIAFAAQAGYRRSEQDPNATAVYRQVRDLVDYSGALRSHIGTLAVEAGVVFLGFDRPTLSRTLRAWRRQFRELRQVMRRESLAGTMYGPAEAVVDAVFRLYQFLTFGEERNLTAAQRLLEDVMYERAGHGDRLARWVAAHLLDLCPEMEASSLYSLLPPGTPPAVARSFALSQPPVMTLWPPQRQLLRLERGNPVDPSTPRSLISVPTSAGKTLMAQLVICSHLAQRSGRVLYVSPMRSLGREMRSALRGRLRMLERRLAAEQPDFPLSSEEESEGSDVEIVTPERLMHMIRSGPEAALDGVGLIVVDEAHHLAQGRRGFILESALGLLRASTSNIRLVLLSAAVGNRGDIASWLDPERPANEVYFTDTWRGPRRLHGLLYPQLISDEVELELRSPSANQPSRWRATVPVEARLDVRPTATSTIARLTTGEVGKRRFASAYRNEWNSRTRLSGGIADYKVFAAGAASLTSAGSVLMVVGTKKEARNTALAIAEHLEGRPAAAALSEYLADTLGPEHPLVRCTRRGVAYHHGDLPDDVLQAVENALRNDQLAAIASTSTLTDGVNLPVRTVIVHSKVQGDHLVYENQRSLSPAELVNAVGRAGRAGRESEGWILLTRPYPPKPTEFDTLNPDTEQLKVVSALLTEEALAALADAEDIMREQADGVFALADSVAADFAAFVWLVLQTQATTPVLDGDRLDAVRSLFAMDQADDDRVTSRWLGLAGRVAEVHEATDTDLAGRWSGTGTSLGSARCLDQLAQYLARQLVQQAADDHSEAEQVWFAQSQPEEWTLGHTLVFLAEHQVFERLLELPEVAGTWRFTTKEVKGTPVDVPLATAVQDWISGSGIPTLAGSWLPDVPAEWALEQAVRNISSGFEHAFSWVTGALINLVNNSPLLSLTTPRLNAYTAWHIRHGVDTEQALSLLTSGITSRRLAHLAGREAAAHLRRPADLRRWLAEQHIDGWTNRYQANEYEIEDLLDYVRSPSNLVNQLLNDRRVITPLVRLTPGASDGPVAIAPPSATSPLIRVGRNKQRLGTVPADRHLDVLAMLDSGLDLAHHLQDGQLITTRRSH
ncbi:DEAD/DEAH box helicase [Streptomyces albidoflavus]|nr:DEAD/DEAH box helicase [Streptomyces albidoflavus]PBO16220.1 DEAD/DEAH box helicase [Streptomyces albidoflavus]PBO23451.1 DEAD/DEAH box helicase [Streptomyces albidoflavus]PBO28920.1 DEAD/DEAH box helicase [Streptomyces albidoflavus]